MANRIAFAKTGWSEDYSGGDVVGRHAHILEGKKAHERFNFLPSDSDEKFYAYIPRIGPRSSPPKPKETGDWLVIFVAAKDGKGPLMAVGWYEHAIFEREYKARPDVSDYLYCVSSDSAWLIPVEKREEIPSDRFKRTSIIYARGNGQDDDWRQKLAVLAEKIVANPELRIVARPKSGFPDSAVRKAVEEAAIKKAMEYLKGKEYRVTDKQMENCGYDLLAKRKRTPDELHVEVKGTGGQEMRFFMSRNEKKYMSHPKWRLLVVTNALGKSEVSLLTANQVEARFQFNPLSWEAVLKKP